MAKPIIIDTDPGIDDAVAIMLAAASPELDIRAITTVAGNVGLANTTGNALALKQLLQLECPVARGAWRTLNRKIADTAAHVHGKTGLGGWDITPAPDCSLSAETAVHLMSRVLRESVAAGQKATIIAIGPLTNVAQLLVADERAADLISEIVIMGGGYGERLGNATPAAEFNIYTDPEAAALVFNSGVKVRMIGLNVTEITTLGMHHLPRVSAAGGSILEGLEAMLPSYQDTTETPGETAQHDALAMSSLVRDDIVEFVPAHIVVETVGELTRGMTVADVSATSANTYLAVASDVDAFRELLNERLGSLAERIS